MNTTLNTQIVNRLITLEIAFESLLEMLVDINLIDREQFDTIHSDKINKYALMIDKLDRDILLKIMTELQLSVNGEILA